MTTPVTIPLPDGTQLPAALAVPEGDGPFPGVVVLFEVFGLNDDIRAKAQRFAAQGYVAVAPDLYAHGSKARCIVSCLREVSGGKPGPVSADIDAVKGWLAGRPDVDGDRLATIGFCLGGGLALVHAAGAPTGVRATSVSYGQVPKDAAALGKVCPVIGSYGGRDKVTGRDGARLERHLDQLGVDHDVKTYPGVGHSFMTPGSGDGAFAALTSFALQLGYGEAEAEDAWSRIFAFFDTHVRGVSR